MLAASLDVLSAHLDGLAVDLVGPSSVVSEHGGGFGDLKLSKQLLGWTHVKSLGSAKRLAIVQSLDTGQNVDIPLHQLGNLDEVFAALKPGTVETPGSIECLVGSFDGYIDIGS